MSAVNELVITPEFVTNIIAVDLADETTFTTADKAKLNGIEAGAQANTVTKVAGKTGAVELDAGDIAYDASETYESGKIGAALKSAEEKLDTINAGDIGYDGSTTYDTDTVGKELTELNRQLSDVEENQIPELKSAFGAFFKDDEVFETELSYTASTTLPQTYVYQGLIPAGVNYKVVAVHTGGVSRIDIKLGTRQTYNTPNANKTVTRNETASSEVNTIQVSIPSDKVSSSGTLTVVVSVENPFDKKVDKSQGAQNAGKILSVDNSGNVALSDDMKYADLKISDNADDIKSVANEENPICIWRSIQSGGFDDDGDIIDSPLYYRQRYAIAYPYEKFKIRILKPGIKARVYFFTGTTPSSSTYISKTDWHDADFVVDVPARSASRTNVFLFILIGRTDVSNLSYEDASMSVEYLFPSSINRLPITRYTESCAIDNGYAYYNANCHISNFIAVSPGDVLKTVKVYAIGFYNSNGDHIQTILASSGSVTAPANSAYMLVEAKTGNIAYVGTEDEINNIYYISGERLENDDSDDVPSVYFENDYLPNKISTIRDNSNVEKGMSFAFVTDMHVNDNSLVSGKLLKYILNNSTIPFIVCGGDIPTAYATEYGSEASECESEAQRWIEYAQSFGWNRFFAVRGNHDFMKPSPQESTQKIYYVAPEYKTYNYISRNNEHVIKRNPPYNYYYIDNVSERIRIIVLDEYENGTYGTEQVLTQEQVDWLLNDALNVTNYHFLFVSHSPFDDDWTNYNPAFVPIQNLFKAIKNKQTISYSSGGISISGDFTNTTNEFIAHLCGHTHLDNYNVDDGVLTITTTCDAFYKTYEHNRVKGAITEPAFDIVSIDTQNKVIKLCRIGEGADRKIVYDDENVYTITQNLSNCFTCFQTTENVYGGSDWTNFYHADSGHAIDNASVSVTMGGVDITSTAWNQNSKRVYIPNITGNVVITVPAIQST